MREEEKEPEEEMLEEEVVDEEDQKEDEKGLGWLRLRAALKPEKEAKAFDRATQET